MLLYQDVITGDEMLSDAYDMKEIDDIAYEVDCAMIIVKDGEVDIGGNPSAEEAEEALEAGASQINNVVHSFRLQPTTFDKKSYLTYLKGYMKAIKTHLQATNPDRVAKFEKGAQDFAKKIVANFKNFEFYVGESMNPEGMVLLLNYREDGTTPFFTAFKDGLKEEDDEVWQAGWWGPDQDDIKRLRKGKARERGERPELDMDRAGLRRFELEDGREAWVVADGCVYIPRYLTPARQLDLLESALTIYTLPPNPLSISTHYALPPNLFELYASSPRHSIQPLHSMRSKLEPRQERLRSREMRHTVETEPTAVVEYQEIISRIRSRSRLEVEPSERLGPKTVEQLMREIRWANLGWVYQWSTKSYDLTPGTSNPFPEDLAELCWNIVRSVPWMKVFQSHGDDEAGNRTDWKSWTEDYKPDTGIVNFYQLNDTLMGHVDRAELDPSRPLVSISLGHAAVFLLGSSSRLDSPTPIILRSGDVLIISGDARQSYHGVPRIMEGTLPLHFLSSTEDSQPLAAAKKWLATGRININARQVFPPGFERPNCSRST
ncbi:MAG: hypothetical protein TREMPRED_001751 [Tremellales sp. Tagirdzhanova-0007]|nr:MAG: hypothetical protein TREMPRED_001751 [Tremellales sp. Tagirdzhanova-0007]